MSSTPHILPNITQDPGSLALATDQLLGIPFKPQGRDLDGFDCWGLVVWYFKNVFGQPLPDRVGTNPFDVLTCSRLFEEGSKSPDWQRVNEPVHGCIVAMSRRKAINHAGIWLDIDGGKCLHIFSNGFVSLHDRRTLERLGMNRIEFFQWLKFLS